LPTAPLRPFLNACAVPRGPVYPSMQTRCGPAERGPSRPDSDSYSAASVDYHRPRCQRKRAREKALPSFLPLRRRGGRTHEKGTMLNDRCSSAVTLPPWNAMHPARSCRRPCHGSPGELAKEFEPQCPCQERRPIWSSICSRSSACNSPSAIPPAARASLLDL
jgi:hypothetical protein